MKKAQAVLAEYLIDASRSMGSLLLIRTAKLGAFIVFLADIAMQFLRRPIRWQLILQHLEFIGNQSLSIIVITAFFIGAVFGLQIGIIFKIFRAEGIMGAATAVTLARELAPVMTAFLLAGRVGSAITAEIATMRVNEQIDAMEAMGVNPIDYLVVPRFIAAVIMTPLLCGVFIFVGIVGAMLIGVVQFDVDKGVFFEKILTLAKPKDVVLGLQKSLAFGAVVATVACRFGLSASGGAKGVGNATTDSVVSMLLTLLGIDLVITYLQLR